MSRRLHILQVGKFYHPHKGGIETHLQDLCEHLNGQVETSVVVANDGKQTVNDIINDIPILRLGTQFTFASAPVNYGLARVIRQSEADIVHIHAPHPTALLAYLKSGRRGALVITHHSDIVRQKTLGRLFDPFQSVALKHCDALIAATPNYLESSPVLSARRDKCHVIPYGINLSEFETIDETAVAEIRARYGERIVLSVGRLVYYKGFEFLIEAMRKVDAQLLIIGTGPLREKLERLAQDCGVAARVHFLGEVPDTAPYYRAADVFALASIARSEAFGIVQLEAMACGTPVVNTNLNSGVPYVSLDGVTGLTVPPANADALAVALNKLFDDPESRHRFGCAARHRVKQEFSLEQMIERTLQLYDEVMAAQK